MQIKFHEVDHFHEMEWKPARKLVPRSFAEPLQHSLLIMWVKVYIET